MTAVNADGDLPVDLCTDSKVSLPRRVYLFLSALCLFTFSLFHGPEPSPAEYRDVAHPQVEGVIQRELERLQIDEAGLEVCRQKPQAKALEAAQAVIATGGDVNARGPSGWF